MFPLSELTGELGLKAIAFNYSKGTFCSPAKQDFEWTTDGLVAAECPECSDVPGESHTCGIYATFRIAIALEYTRASLVSPILLVEAAGKTILYTDGFRSKQVLVRAVLVMGSMGVNRMIAAQAADFFKVPVLSQGIAINAMDLWNWYKNPWYTPSNENIARLGRENAIETLANYLGVHPKGELVWQVFPQSQEST